MHQHNHVHCGNIEHTFIEEHIAVGYYIDTTFQYILKGNFSGYIIDFDFLLKSEFLVLLSFLLFLLYTF